MSDDIAISVDNVSKAFKLPHEKQSSIKGAVVNVFRGKKTYERQQVLKDVSFEIKKGEFFGIVGRNGSGKSTLLKLLAGIYAPDKGAIHVNGNLTPFIELGVGFNPELTGRENVFLNGALLGFSRKEMNAMYQEIVGFAELEKFMDQKLKNYSSGMQVRLAFSIAIRAKSDILLIDEVLAVGDQGFQEKCYRYFSELKRANQTVVFVTHDMASVERYCDRVLLLDKSYINNGIYSVGEAASYYNQLNHSENQPDVSQKNRQNNLKKAYIERVRLIDKNGKTSRNFFQGDSLTIEVKIKNNELPKNENIVIGLAFYDSVDVNLSGPNSLNQKISIDDKTIRYTVNSLPFNKDDYRLTVALFDQYGVVQYDILDKEIPFFVNTDTLRHGKVVLDGVWGK